MSTIKTVIRYAEASNIISTERAVEAERELDRMETINHQLSDGLHVQGVQLTQIHDELRVLRGIAEGDEHAKLFDSASDDAKRIEKSIHQLRTALLAEHKTSDKKNLERIIWYLKTNGTDPWGDIANDACAEIAEMEDHIAQSDSELSYEIKQNAKLRGVLREAGKRIRELRDELGRQNYFANRR